MVDLRTFIRDVPDFPKKGIIFKDITPLLASPNGLAMAVEVLCNPFRGLGIQAVIGAESRGAHLFGKVAIRGRDHAHIEGDGSGAAQTLHLTLLQHAQDFGLQA